MQAVEDESECEGVGPEGDLFAEIDVQSISYEELILADESAMAIASAKLNASRLMPHSCDAISFHQDDGLTNYRGPQPHLILCNPPFHLNHTVDEYAGRRLLVQSARHLPTGGRLWPRSPRGG